MSNRNSETFDQLADNLVRIKQAVYDLHNTEHVNREQEAEIIDILRSFKEELLTTQTSLKLYIADVNSTIQHIDNTLQRRSSLGGKKCKTKRTTYRKRFRHSRKHC